MLNVKNSKKNNCWLSIYVFRTDWIETPSSIKYFLFFTECPKLTLTVLGAQLL